MNHQCRIRWSESCQPRDTRCAFQSLCWWKYFEMHVVGWTILEGELLQEQSGQIYFTTKVAFDLILWLCAFELHAWIWIAFPCCTSLSRWLFFHVICCIQYISISQTVALQSHLYLRDYNRMEMRASGWGVMIDDCKVSWYAPGWYTISSGVSLDHGCPPGGSACSLSHLSQPSPQLVYLLSVVHKAKVHYSAYRSTDGSDYNRVEQFLLSSLCFSCLTSPAVFFRTKMW